MLMVMKEGTEMKTMTRVEMMWSVILFFFKAAQMPSPIPAGTEIKTGQILVFTVVHRRESLQEDPMMTTMESTLGAMDVEVPQVPWNKPLIQEQY